MTRRRGLVHVMNKLSGRLSRELCAIPLESSHDLCAANGQLLTGRSLLFILPSPAHHTVGQYAQFCGRHYTATVTWFQPYMQMLFGRN